MRWWPLLASAGLVSVVLVVWAAILASEESWDIGSVVALAGVAIAGGSMALVLAGRRFATARVRRQNQSASARYDRAVAEAGSDYESRVRWSAADYARRLRAREDELEAARRHIVEARRNELLADCDSPHWSAQVGEGPSGTRPPPDGLGQFTRVEAGVAGALSAAELLWSWARIDPDVIRAAAFASPDAHIDSGFDFVGYIHDHFVTLGPDAQAHAFDRLVGYVGEQRYLDLMTAHGDTVVQAITPNQPVWDFIVNGQAVNVKTIADVGSIHAEAIAHPDVIYAVPTDYTGTLTPNMHPVVGLSHAQAVGHLHQAVAAAKGDTAMWAFTHHVPVVMVGMAMHRGRAQLLAGHDLSRVASQTAFSVGFKTLGAVGGAHGGVAIGFWFGPHGAVAGGALGAAAGVVGGQIVFDKLKLEPFNHAVAEMEDALSDYWSSAPYRDRMRIRLHEERVQRTALLHRFESARRAVLASERWERWPAPEDAAILATERYARMAASAAEEQCATIQNLLDRADQPSDEEDKKLAESQLGVILINAPELAAWLGADDAQRQRIAACRTKLLYSRERLFPGSTPYSKAKAVVARARGSLRVRCVPLGATFHDDSVTITNDLHGSCPILDEELELIRQRIVRKMKPGQAQTALREKRQEILTKWEKTIAEADASFSWARLARRRRVVLTTCDSCKPKIDRRVEQRLAEMASPRPGWHIATVATPEWRCDRHNLTVCPTCVDNT